MAFSGGQDSTFLLALAADTLGREKALAAMIVSTIFPQTGLRAARRTARAIGVQLVELAVPQLTDLNLIVDPLARFQCKKMVFDKLKKIADDRNIAAVVSGVHTDKLEDPRFFSQEEAQRLGLRRPLMAADMNKADIRAALGTLIFERPDQAP